MLNRIEAPAFNTIDKIDIIQATKQVLDNGIEVYTVSAGSQELSRIEFIFKAGMYYQHSPLIASCANNMAETGTNKRTADEISDGIDFYGSFFECGADQDYAHFTVFSLNKYLDETLEFTEDIIKNPIFPKHEFDIMLSNRKQKHIVNSKKVNMLVRREFNKLIFGAKHPYGVEVHDNHFDELQLQQIIDFYQSHYHSGNCTIIASGKLPDNLISILNKRFGKNSWGSLIDVAKDFVPFQTTTQQKNLILKDDAIQSAIRIGRPLFNRTHDDYFKFQVLNTLLGGYFGSRLMANIREDKGYTYGIGSGLGNLIRGGFFFISTEVGVDVTQKALTEIYKEVALLREETVSDEELELVKNYLLGQFLRTVEGPFALADKFKVIWEFGLTYDYFEQYFNQVKSVQAKELKSLAQKYLQEKDLIECVVGKM
jgi:predicted Zn-dependent peptidase